MSYKQKNVLVTGADGFIGSHLSEELVKKGANVTALAQYNSFGSNGWLDKVDQSIRGDLTIKRGDIRDSACVNAIVEKQEIVFHLAALIAIPFSYEAPQLYLDVNVSGTLNVLEAARRFGIERMVQTSTSEVYGSAEFTPITEGHPLHGQSPYSASKIAA
ncbi:MAG: NAD-dependent dehydratase, partial [Rhodospirillaceae bacterium]|nr:NAD-dependent dehydratase [Rhodospirillaceae bacterium]